MTFLTLLVHFHGFGTKQVPFRKELPAFRYRHSDIAIFRYCGTAAAAAAATAAAALGIVARDERRNAGNRYAYLTLLTLPYLTLNLVYLIYCINITFLHATFGCQSVAKTPKFALLPRKYGGTAKEPLERHPFFVVAYRP